METELCVYSKTRCLHTALKVIHDTGIISNANSYAMLNRGYASANAQQSPLIAFKQTRGKTRGFSGHDSANT